LTATPHEVAPNPAETDRKKHEPHSEVVRRRPLLTFVDPLAPQHSASQSVVTPHEWSFPADTMAQLAECSDGSVALRRLLLSSLPQQIASLSVVTPHAYLYPVDTIVNRSEDSISRGQLTAGLQA
jgi:hypothetical protein